MSIQIYQAVNAVTEVLAHSGIAKKHRNEQDGYAYRSIDDVMAALAPLFAKNKLCVLPRILERQTIRHGRDGTLIVVRAAFDMVSALDGSSHSIETFGEAFDEGDKATAKAVSAAYKMAMLQAFCIPVPLEDADAATPDLNGKRTREIVFSEPTEGWENWVGETIEIIKSCETAEAIERLTASRRQGLGALQRSRPKLYAEIGEAITVTLNGLPNHNAPKSDVKRKPSPRKKKGNTDEAPVSAEAA